jgi:hypothetical protein
MHPVQLKQVCMSTTTLCAHHVYFARLQGMRGGNHVLRLQHLGGLTQQVMSHLATTCSQATAWLQAPLRRRAGAACRT